MPSLTYSFQKCILYNYQILDTARDLIQNNLTHQSIIGIYCALSVNLVSFHKTGKTTPFLYWAHDKATPMSAKVKDYASERQL